MIPPTTLATRMTTTGTVRHPGFVQPLAVQHQP